ncbi:cation:proton antiporter [Halorarius litoreus]|uniref:cation:proton antiporter n=1 Tax=Halorarius litoreus TaxID=2962676 RepID=UPI0020CF7019|nr:cation:proton antiporter [Halorarius litoreus]
MAVVPSFDISSVVLVQIAVLLVVARALGGLAARIGVTRVVGELATGFVLGPSVLGAVAPGTYAALFPSDGGLLGVLSLLGLVLLLTLAGMELDFDLVGQQFRSVAVVAAVGLAVPFGLGVALGSVLPGALLGEAVERPIFALFLATALSISAIPVVVRILIDLDVFDWPVGQLTVGIAMFTDVVGWLLLSVVVGLARTGAVDAQSIVRVVVTVAAFLAAAVLVGGRLLGAAFARLDAESVGGQLVVVLAAALVGGAVTIGLGIEPALGAFVVGLLLSRSGGVSDAATELFERLTLSVFAPLFFGIAGLRADLSLLFEPTVLLVAALTLVVATVGKFVGVYVAASWLGHSRLEAFAMGAGLNARGAIEIVIAAVGLELGILSPAMYTVVLVVAVLTSAMAAPLLRRVVARLPAAADASPASRAATGRAR